MNEKKIKTIQSKCLADTFVWLGFEYTKTENGYVFERSYLFDLAWRGIHILRQRLEGLR